MATTQPGNVGHLLFNLGVSVVMGVVIGVSLKFVTFAAFRKAPPHIVQKANDFTSGLGCGATGALMAMSCMVYKGDIRIT
jgi:hypothetical protein